MQVTLVLKTYLTCSLEEVEHSLHSLWEEGVEILLLVSTVHVEQQVYEQLTVCITQNLSGFYFSITVYTGCGGSL